MYHGIKGLINEDKLKMRIEINKDGYGSACVKVAINVMRHIDDFVGDFNIGYSPDMTTPHGIICTCDDQGGITGFMAGAARNMVLAFHRDGWKFWLADVISPYDIKDGEVDDLDKRVKTLLNFDAVSVTEAQIREYVAGLVERYELTKGTK